MNHFETKNLPKKAKYPTRKLRYVAQTSSRQSSVVQILAKNKKNGVNLHAKMFKFL